MAPETQELITWIVGLGGSISAIGLGVWKLRDNAVATYWKAIGDKALVTDDWMARALSSEGETTTLKKELKLVTTQRNDFARALLEIEQHPERASEIVDAVLLSSLARTARADMPTPLGLEEITSDRDEVKLLESEHEDPADRG